MDLSFLGLRINTEMYFGQRTLCSPARLIGIYRFG
jgi:hypothetical protein